MNQTTQTKQNELIDIFEGSIVSIWESKQDKTICLRVGPMTLTVDKKDEKKVFRQLVHALDKYMEARLN